MLKRLTPSLPSPTLSYNNVQALDEQALQYRAASSVSVGGLYFSTFYGGSDSSWAPSSDTNAYFRNFQLWGSSAASNLTGAKVSGAQSLVGMRPAALTWAAGAIALAGAFFGVGL